MKLNVITNSRPTSNLGATLIVGCTSGQIKITPDFGKRLGIVDGDYLAVGKDAEDNVWCFKGSDEGQAKGNKLAKSGNFLSMSSQNTWDILEGDTDYNKSFRIEAEEEDEAGKYLQIVFDEQTEKVERRPSGEGEDELEQEYQEN